MKASRIKYISRKIETDDYSIHINLRGNLSLNFERRKEEVPKTSLDLMIEKARFSLPLKHHNFGFARKLEELARLEDEEPMKWREYVNKRAFFLSQLCMNFQEGRQEIYKNQLQESHDFIVKYSEQFLERWKLHIKRLRASGDLVAAAMRNAGVLLDIEQNGKISSGFNREIDFYSELYIGWSHLAQASKDFSRQLGEDSEYLERKVDKEFGVDLKNVAYFLEQISGKALEGEQRLQLLISQALFFYRIKLESVEKPELGELKEKIWHNINNPNMPGHFKPYL